MIREAQKLIIILTALFWSCAAGVSAHDHGDSGLPRCAIPAIEDDNIGAREYDFRSQNPEVGVKANVSIPQLSSRPDAAVTLYLDFDGHPAHLWGGTPVPATPPYDRDGNTASLTQAEADSIAQIWQRVAESFSPFDVNVTTVDPGSLPKNKAIKMIVGGDNNWLPGAGGVAVVGSFAFNSPRWAFCFPKNLGNGHPKYTADCISHEAGHTLGLSHQARWVNGVMEEAYDIGTPERAPIMGVAYYSERGLWWSGPTDDSIDVQNDIPSMLSLTNFTLAADDHGDSPESATVLSVSNQVVSGEGTIETLTDEDMFYFASGAGILTLNVDPLSQGGTLDVKAALLDHTGNVIAASAPANGLSASFSLPVTEGIYYLKVASQANYPGDLGTYIISGTTGGPSDITPTPTPQVTPTAVPTRSATPRPGRPTATPSPRPIKQERMSIVSPSEGTLLGKTVIIRVLTRRLDTLSFSDNKKRTRRVKIKNSESTLTAVRYKISGRSSSLVISGYLSKKLITQKQLSLRAGRAYSSSKKRRK